MVNLKRKEKVSGSILEKGNLPLIIGFLFPAVASVMFFTYYPAVQGIIMAFQRVSVMDLYNTPFVGFDNFKNLFATMDFLRYWQNTFIWVVGCVGAELILGFTIALLLQKPFFGKRLYESIVFVPWALSGFTVGVIFQWIFNGTIGLANDLLMRMGFISIPIGFLSSPSLALPTVMIAKVWTGMAFFAIIIMAALKTIPRELYESAEIDGAGRVACFFKITLPSIRNLLTVIILVRSLSTFGASDLIVGMSKGGPAGASHTVSSYIMVEVLRGIDYGRVSAAGVTMWLFLLACSLLYLGVTRGFKKED